MQTAEKTDTRTRASMSSASKAPPAPTRYDDVARLLIGGVWREGRSGAVAADKDPYSGEILAEISLANWRDVDEAFVTAQWAQKGWAAVPPQERRTLMENASLVVESRKAEIIDLLIRESGSTYSKALFEWELTRDELKESASRPFHADGQLLPASVRGKDSHVFRQAAGVVAVISPWNFPLYLSMRSVAPALALGNTVVIKPASDTPITGALLIARIFEEAGLPPEVLSAVVGSATDIGDYFVDHPASRVVSFTGSTAVGRHVGEHAGRAVKRVCLELGGNCPFIVLRDADIERAVSAAVAGKFLHQGQICIAINRILVDQRVHDEFTRLFLERVADLKVGNPADIDTDIGPIINQTQLDGIIAKVEDTIRMGARVLLRDKFEGLSLAPIVLDDVTNHMPAAHEELFGPVAPILTFQDEAEAVHMANDTEYGLSSAVFTKDVDRGMRMAKRLETGMTHINDWTVNVEANTAFGGEKQSGVGRFGGDWATDEFTTSHWISVQHTPRAYPL